MIKQLCVAGAGTMGSGIAFVCAQHGFATILFDVTTKVLNKAKESVQSNIDYLLSKQKITAEEGKHIFNNISFSNDINNCVADLFIEAIIEDATAKVALFNQFAEMNGSDTIFATNTSSLSVTQIQQGITNPARVAGMHFFNPAPAMKLVEVVSGALTNQQTTQYLLDFCLQLGKTPVLCQDAPGFIVNRVARHYYLEAMKILSSEICCIEDVDALMEAAGFKMGPFKLMDLIGLDINLAVSESLYERCGAVRFKPSVIQVDKVNQGKLGKKSGQGFYAYS